MVNYITVFTFYLDTGIGFHGIIRCVASGLMLRYY